MCMLADVSIVFAGNTASGKTSTLNALFSFVPEERIVILEETPEIRIDQNQTVRLIAFGDTTMADLISDTLRMRPDRTIVGEVRTQDEIKALFNTILSGQARSTYATFHAQSSAEAINRFLFMGINEADINALDLIVVQRRMMKAKERKEIRRCIEIFDVKTRTNIFSYDSKMDKLLMGPTKDCWVIKKICQSFDFDLADFKRELKNEEKKLGRGIC